MIKDIIFDFGQVLVSFEPLYMTAFYVDNEKDRNTVAEAVFDRKYWDRLDDGTITYGEIISDFKTRLPERLWAGAEAALVNWIDHLPEIDGMREILKKIKAMPGVRLFLLSNISREFAERSGEIPILEFFDGCVFSATCGYTKPKREIFEHICEKFDISPESAVFIDDSAKNIKGARDFGLNAVLFEGAEKLISVLNEMGVEI